MSLVGYDWAPWGVDMVTKDHEKSQRFLPDPETYVWQEGASKISEALLKGTEPLINVEHALHVLEVIEATRESQKKGKRIEMKSTFKWPVV
jgi:predicted dehydrogenase